MKSETTFEATVKTTLTEAYNKAIDHSISVIKDYSYDYPLLNDLFIKIIEDLKKLK